jgi:hypothetical protein
MRKDKTPEELLKAESGFIRDLPFCSSLIGLCNRHILGAVSTLTPQLPHY